MGFDRFFVGLGERAAERAAEGGVERATERVAEGAVTSPGWGKRVWDFLFRSPPGPDPAGLLRTRAGLIGTGVVGTGLASGGYYLHNEREKVAKEKREFLAARINAGRTPAEAEEDWKKEEERRRNRGEKPWYENLLDDIKGFFTDKKSFGTGSALGLGIGAASFLLFPGMPLVSALLTVGGGLFGQKALNAFSAATSSSANTAGGGTTPATNNLVANTPAQNPPVEVPNVPRPAAPPGPGASHPTPGS